MKISLRPFFFKAFIIKSIFLLYSLRIIAQQPITSILTSNITQSTVTYTGIKGAGLRSPSLSLISFWDSTGTSFTVKFNAPSTANILRLNQFTVGSFTSNVITMPVESHVKLRRASNADIGDARNYYNFWAQYSSSPALGATTGTFNFTAPEVINPEDAFILNNLTSGYDNIFQNTIANPHLGNIERVDFIIPEGLKCFNNTDRLESGVAVIDRGAGDPFKIAVITGLNASGDPSSFGSLVSVTAASFGANLLPAAINYGILINDVKYRSESRPSTQASQNLKGVYISLADLGIAIGQQFYGYALFGPDVVTPNIDWTTYPNNTNGGSMLDPVNIMGLYKTPGSVLAMPIKFTAVQEMQTARLEVKCSKEYNGTRLVFQRSTDGTLFHDLQELQISPQETYTYIDHTPTAGKNYYRVKIIGRDRSATYTETRLLEFDTDPRISIYPNPAKTQLNIKLPLLWTQKRILVEIYTITGKLVKRTTIDRPATLQTVPVHTLNPGTYLLRLIRSGDLVTIQKSITIL
jgi:hypothetical protein